MLTQAQFDSLLLPQIYHHFDLGETRVPSMRGRLYNVQSSSLSEERGTGMGAMGTDAWNQYNETGKKGQLGFDELYTQTYTHVEYPVELIIEKKLVLNDQYGVIQRKISRAALSAEVKMEKDAATLWINAFSTPLSDGKALCANDHPLSANAESGIQDNFDTLALTAENVSTVRTRMQRFTDDAGDEIGVMPNSLLVPPELEDAAIKAVGSPLNPDSANNAINPQAGRWTVLPWLRLTDVNAWFVMDDLWRSEVVNWYNRESLVVMMVRETTTEIVYELKLHYSFGADDWRWIYGCNPS